MVPVLALWLPILVSAIAVFLVSSFIHMVLPYHRNDFRGFPAEDELLGLVRRGDVPPGEYMAPHAGSPERMKDPAFQEKLRTNPMVTMTVSAAYTGMGKSLTGWFVYCLAITIFAAYLTGRAVPPGGEFMEVLRFATTTAFLGYAFALWHGPIWYHRPWTTTLKYTVDGLIYGLVTALIFGWLWPA